jgi:hypothetical protein
MSFPDMNSILEIIALKVLGNLTPKIREENQALVIVNESLDVLNRYVSSRTSCKLLASTNLMS